MLHCILIINVPFFVISYFREIHKYINPMLTAASSVSTAIVIPVIGPRPSPSPLTKYENVCHIK